MTIVAPEEETAPPRAAATTITRGKRHPLDWNYPRNDEGIAQRKKKKQSDSSALKEAI